MSRPTSWSFTSWSVADDCPFQYYQSWHLGNRAPQHPSAARGESIHKFAEYYLKGEIEGIPHVLAKFASEFIELKKAQPVVERFWGVTEDWEFKDGRAWCTMKMDAAVLPTKKDPTLVVIDFKTGKEYPKHPKQGELYAAIGFAKHPEIEEAITEFWYTDLGYPIQRTYSREELKELKELWQSRGTTLLSKQSFKPKPSLEACKWCHLRTDRGGVCNEWTKVYG